MRCDCASTCRRKRPLHHACAASTGIRYRCVYVRYRILRVFFGTSGTRAGFAAMRRAIPAPNARLIGLVHLNTVVRPKTYAQLGRRVSPGRTYVAAIEFRPALPGLVAPEIGALSAPSARLSLVTSPSEPRQLTALGRLTQPSDQSPGIGQRDRLAKLLERQHGVLSRAQAGAYGAASRTIDYRIRPGGPWRRIFPGVYLSESGSPTARQLDIAAPAVRGQPDPSDRPRRCAHRNRVAPTRLVA